MGRAVSAGGPSPWRWWAELKPWINMQPLTPPLDCSLADVPLRDIVPGRGVGDQG